LNFLLAVQPARATEDVAPFGRRLAAGGGFKDDPRACRTQGRLALLPPAPITLGGVAAYG
jgi:hypothetical protein